LQINDIAKYLWFNKFLFAVFAGKKTTKTGWKKGYEFEKNST